MNKILIQILFYVILILSIVGLIAYAKSLQAQLDAAINNEKAYAIQNSSLTEKNIAFKMTIDQLTFFNDSLMCKMKEMANENGIKDKNIRSLQYQLETYKKVDKIIVHDTIFKEVHFKLDTCINDYWNSTCVSLEYPNIIELDHKYRNDKYLIINSKKEPIKPRKWFLPRWFTRKHTIAEITVIDQNPNVQTEKQTFIEIIK